ncbi:MAG: hypothetical protein ACT4OK_00850 [Gemmobacter sp.]
MPVQNRVLPTGDIVADPARGTLTGNRGILHDDHRHLGSARWRHPHWISCTLDWKNTRRTPMSPGTWTELFFLDEAVALAAGHRPCALCRRPEFRAFQGAWARGTGLSTDAPTIDRALHAARVTRDRRQVRHQSPLDALPDGTFILWKGTPHLVRARQMHPFTPAAYLPPLPRPDASVTVLTPAPMVATLAAGYAPLMHPTAEAP